jgi:integrase
MAVLMKLEHLVTKNGKLTFRRRIPQDLLGVIRKTFFQETLRSQQHGVTLVREHAALMDAFQRMVADGREGVLDGTPKQYAEAAWTSLGDSRSELERWREVKVEAQRLLNGVSGFRDEDERRDILADDLAQRGADPMLYRAVVSPDAEPPQVTLKDARNMYLKENMKGGKGRNQMNRLDRVCARVAKSLGPLDRLPLVDLKREHARKLRDDMLNTTKSDGSVLSPASVKREMNMVRAMVSTAIKEFDLQGKASNPFEKLDIAGADAVPEVEGDRRDPLPPSILKAVRQSIMESVKVPELKLIWRLLEKTGCRGAEITGLRVEDVQLDQEYPHILVRWHEDRRVKTAVSIRSVPLLGDALAAAREALKLAGDSVALFPRYAHEGGADAVSQALMKYVRRQSKDKRHVVYSLRHNMKDWLMSAGVPERDEHRILGHSLGGVGNRVYGGGEAKLRASTTAMEKALEVAEEWLKGR